jgi:hypothetical protein
MRVQVVVIEPFKTLPVEGMRMVLSGKSFWRSSAILRKSRKVSCSM